MGRGASRGEWARGANEQMGKWASGRGGRQVVAVEGGADRASRGTWQAGKQGE